MRSVNFWTTLLWFSYLPNSLFSVSLAKGLTIQFILVLFIYFLKGIPPLSSLFIPSLSLGDFIKSVSELNSLITISTVQTYLLNCRLRFPAAYSMWKSNNISNFTDPKLSLCYFLSNLLLPRSFLDLLWQIFWWLWPNFVLISPFPF